MREPSSENLKKMIFLNGTVDGLCSALHDILRDDDSKTCTDCILALRKNAVDTEGKKEIVVHSGELLPT